MASTSESQRSIAQKTWEMSNNILEISSGEEIYKYDKQQQQQMLAAKPWEKDHHFFKDIKVYILFSRTFSMFLSFLISSIWYIKNGYKYIYFKGVSISPFKNGNACKIWWQLRGHGAPFGQS